MHASMTHSEQQCQQHDALQQQLNGLHAERKRLTTTLTAKTAAGDDIARSIAQVCHV